MSQEAIFDGFTDGLPFTLSAYQQEALRALAQPNASVLVVAPTGSGKSVVADAAIWQALTQDRTVAYTSPLRVLANQRFSQLSALWGNRAGLITGDRTIRAHAPVRVMTTEVYRTLALLTQGRRADPPTPLASGNPQEHPLIQRGRSAEPRDRWVIFDEAHYLADPDRGSVWEEAILATPAATRILCLSATIGAPERLAGWLRWLGREVVLVEATVRPVPLRHYLALRGALHLVLDEHGRRAGSFPFAGGWALAQRRPNPHRRGAGPLRHRREPPISGLPAVSPDEWVRQEAIAAIHLLREERLTPAIAFVSSRREAERLAQDARDAFPAEAGGVAFHHAGLPPTERRAIEERLRNGEIWLVCGTTTLAAGLDVPARSVLLTSFGRFDGREFSLFSPAEYRQLTGRAGRLGKDERGAAVLLASPWHSFEEAFRKLTAPLPPLQSAFRPGYTTALAWCVSMTSSTDPAASLAGPPGNAAGEYRFAMVLSTTFAAYLRRLRGTQPPPPLDQPDGASLLQARAMGKLLELDGLVDTHARLTPRGRFVLAVGGIWEGRLLLRLLEEGAFEPLDTAAQTALLACVAEGVPPSVIIPEAPGDAALAQTYRGAHAEQVALERQAGALLTPPLPPPPRPGSVDPWRHRQAAADLLERALRASRQSGLPLSIAEWGTDLLANLVPGQ